MKKNFVCGILSLLAGGLLISSTALSFGSVQAQENRETSLLSDSATSEQSVKYADFFEKFVKNELRPVSNAYAEIALKATEDPKKGFLDFTGVKNGDPYFQSSSAREAQIAFGPLQIIAHDGYYAAITVKAVKDMKLTVSVPKLGENYQWVANEGQTNIGYYISDGISTDFVKQELVAKDAEYGYTAHLKAGESLYYTIHSRGWSTVDLVPSFLFGDDYDENWTYETLKKERESVLWEEMVSLQALSGGGKQEKELFDFWMFYGTDLDHPEGYECFLGTEDWQHELYYGMLGSEVCAAWRWQWRTSGGYVAAVVFEAKEDVFLNVTHPLIDLGSYVAPVKVITAVENEKGIRLIRRTYLPKVKNEENSYFSSEHLKKGDKLYAYIEGSEKGISASYTIQSGSIRFEADTKLYDETKRADFAKEEKLIAYRAQKVQEMQDYIGTLKESDYTLVGWSEINDYANEIASLLADRMDEEAVDKVFDETKAKIEAVPTIAETQAELNAYKSLKKAEINAYVKQEDYSDENWKIVQGYLQTAEKAIETAKSETGVDTAVAAARNKIDRVEKKKAEKSGCGSVLGGWIGAITVVTAIGLFWGKKKNEENG